METTTSPESRVKAYVLQHKSSPLPAHLVAPIESMLRYLSIQRGNDDQETLERILTAVQTVQTDSTGKHVILNATIDVLYQHNTFRGRTRLVTAGTKILRLIAQEKCKGIVYSSVNTPPKVEFCLVNPKRTLLVMTKLLDREEHETPSKCSVLVFSFLLAAFGGMADLMVGSRDFIRAVLKVGRKHLNEDTVVFEVAAIFTALLDKGPSPLSHMVLISLGAPYLLADIVLRPKREQSCRTLRTLLILLDNSTDVRALFLRHPNIPWLVKKLLKIIRGQSQLGSAMLHVSFNFLAMILLNKPEQRIVVAQSKALRSIVRILHLNVFHPVLSQDVLRIVYQLVHHNCVPEGVVNLCKYGIIRPLLHTIWNAKKNNDTRTSETNGGILFEIAAYHVPALMEIVEAVGVDGIVRTCLLNEAHHILHLVAKNRYDPVNQERALEVLYPICLKCKCANAERIKEYHDV